MPGIKVTVLPMNLDAEQRATTRVFDKPEITVGRSPSNDIVLEGSEVSGEHLRIRIGASENGELRLFVTDLGSTNGTMLDSQPLQPHFEIELEPRRRVIVGKYLLKSMAIEDEVVLAEQTRPSGAFQRQSRQIDDTQIRAQRQAAGSGEPKAKSSDEQVDRARPQRAERATPPPPKRDSAKNRLDRPPRTATSDSQPSTMGSFTIKVGQNSVEDFNIEARELLSLQGTVAHHGRPLQGVVIDGGELGEVTTDGNGKFRFSDLPEQGLFKVKPSLQNYLFQPESADGVLTSDVKLEFAAIKIITISGIVTHHGTPLAGVEIDGGALGKTITAPDGRYSFRVPEDAEYTLAISKSGYLFGQKDGD